MGSSQMTGGSKGSKNCVRVLENVNRKEKVIKSKSLEIDNLGRYTLQDMIRCRRWLRQIFRGQDTKGSCYRADTDVIKNYERKNGLYSYRNDTKKYIYDWDKLLACASKILKVWGKKNPEEQARHLPLHQAQWCIEEAECSLDSQVPVRARRRGT